MKERWFNYRPLCLIFGFLLLGSVFSLYVVSNTLVTIIISLICLSILVVISILKKKLKYALIPIIAFCIGIGCYYTAFASFNIRVDYTPSVIQARIYNISKEVNHMVQVECDSCQFNGENIKDNVILYIYDNDSLFENIEVGGIIKFKPYRFYKSDLFSYDTPNSYIYTNDLKYVVSAKIEDVTYIETDKTFAETIKEKVRENLLTGLTNENAEIAYSSLFGDKDLMSNKQYNVFKLSGVAHLLAVSGLHVGIIVTILTKFLDITKVKKWYKFGVVGLFLLFYCYICGYSVSVLRASIMSMVLLLAGILRKEYDGFNAIAIAGIIIYLLNPFCIFDVAFLLSFSCVTGILMLSRPIKKALINAKFPKVVADSLALSLATTISIVFIMAFYFRTVNIVAILANIIIIPIFTLVYVCIFVVSIISLLLPFIKVSLLLHPVNYVLNLISLIATFLGSLTISNLYTIEFNYIAIILYFTLLLFLGRFCTVKNQHKIIATLPMVALLFYCLI